jgi:hypothetical protein
MKRMFSSLKLWLSRRSAVVTVHVLQTKDAFDSSLFTTRSSKVLKPSTACPLQFFKKTFDSYSVLLYQYTHALNQCGTYKEANIMITAIVTFFITAIATGMLGMAAGDRV